MENSATRFVVSVVVGTLFGALPAMEGRAAEPVNIAPLGVASQSSDFAPFVAALAIDGNLANFTATGRSDVSPWWQVELPRPFALERVVLRNRGDGCCPERLRDITVSILEAGGGDPLFVSEVLNPGNALGGPAQIELDLVALTGAPVDGSVVRVARTPDPAGTGDDANLLSLGEVEVFTSEIPPDIARQPAGGRVYVGGCHVMSVGLIGVDDAVSVAYQWFHDGSPIEGAVGDRLVLGDLSIDDAGDYTVEVNADGIELVSEPATVEVPGLNLALHGTATQSSDFAASYVAVRAADGNLKNFTATAGTDPSPWWQVELEQRSPIERVVLHNRGDGCCQERLRDITVSVLDAGGGDPLFVSELLNPGNALGGPARIELDLVALTGAAVDGSIVRVARTRDPAGTGDDASLLSLGEVEVFGDGPLPGPDPNLARRCGVTARQSSDYPCCGGFPAPLAIDGDLENFTATAPTDESPTWEVDLGSEAQIGSVVIHNRRNCCPYRLRDITVSILDPSGEVLLWQSELLNPENVLGGGGQGGPGALVVTLSAGPDRFVLGQIVRVQRTPDPDLSGQGGVGTDDDKAVLSLGEVEVFEPVPCPDEGDTHCTGLTLQSDTLPGLPGIFTATATGTDDGGDPVLYTFVLEDEDGPVQTIGPQEESSARLEIGIGTWTVSVTVDDEILCPDEADDARREVAVEIAIPGTNLAPAGTAGQSSTWGNNQFPPELAIDGNLQNFSHTAAGDNPSFWEVDLGTSAEINAVVLYNRRSCCGSRLRDITISVLDVTGVVQYESALLNPENVLGGGTLAGPSTLGVLLLDELGGPVVGRVVRITRTPDPDLSGTGGEGNPDEPDSLGLAEVQVFGTAIPCPEEGDTHCGGLTVERADLPGGEGTFPYTTAAIGSDESGDEILYTFTATLGDDPPMVVGPQTENVAILDLTVGEWTVTVTVDDDPTCDDVSGDATCTRQVSVTPPGVGPFSRGDANADGRTDLSDAIYSLNYLFLGGPAPPCVASADGNGDGKVDISDAQYELNYLFLGGPPLPAPFPGCSTSSDPGDMALGCTSPTCP